MEHGDEMPIVGPQAVFVQIGVPRDGRSKAERMTAGIPRSAHLLRFLDQVEIDNETECWIWTGGTVPSQRTDALYGKLKRDKKTMLAHRWAYQEFIGPLLASHEIHHTCLRTLCVYPKHLEQVENLFHRAFHPPGYKDDWVSGFERDDWESDQ